jgi:hypothetical protein
MVSSWITPSEKLANSPMTTLEIATTKPATQSDNWMENDVRIFFNRGIGILNVGLIGLQ